MTVNSKALATLAVHAGEIQDAHGSPRTPLYTTTTFKFDSTAKLLDVVEGRQPGYLYTRYGSNPTIQALESKLAALDHTETALAFGAGMAAISATLLAHGQQGIICLGDVYGGTWQLLNEQLSQLKLTMEFLPAHAYDALEAALARGLKLVYFESPSNPTLEIIDIHQVVQRAHACGALVAIDNSFASPINQQPHALGVDLVIHSATKYLGGHSDLTAGTVSGTQELLSPIAAWRKNLGQIIAPETAHLLSRSLSTLELRVQRQNQTAGIIARDLEHHPRIQRIFYPGLRSFPGHTLASRQMTGYGGMLTLEIAGNAADAASVVDHLKLISLAPSLGGVESLITQPCTTSHRDLTPEQRQQCGISDAMLRLSVGLEDPGDLITDLEQALGQLGSSVLQVTVSRQ